MKNLRFYLSAAGVAAIDRLTKLLWGNSRQPLIPGVLALNATRNSGMAFGWLPGGTLVLAVLSLAVCAGLIVWISRRPRGRLCQYGAGLLLGGALGNLIDRVALGYVIDFIDPVFLHWFVFNVADAGVTCGAALLLIYLLFGKEEKHS